MSGVDTTSGSGSSIGANGVNHVEDFYESWFLEYASYVIFRQAVPNIEDGLKPVQRRILHSMDELEDGRYNKAANVIGNTMKYHPHGDMAISDAMVKIAQKTFSLICRTGVTLSQATAQQLLVISKHVFLNSR